MRVHVYHTTEPTFGGEAPPWPESYAKVAAVEVSDSLDDIGAAEAAFEVTNTINEPWWFNKNVQAVAPARSTSVGDVVRLLDGRLLRCEVAGWVPMGEEER